MPCPPIPPASTDARYPFYQDMRGNSPTGRTSLANIYLRRYAAIAKLDNSLTGNPNTREEILNNQGAECLYMVITLATGDGEARSQFGESNIGDTDGDGALEFLDGWGQPIKFLRWAPGFDSPIQINANQLGAPPTPSSLNTVWSTASSNDHDPFDIFRIDPPAFRLVPLDFRRRPRRIAGHPYRELVRGVSGANPIATDRGNRRPDNWPAIFAVGTSG